MRNYIKILLFLSSYAPLFLICAISQKNNRTLWHGDVWGFGILSVVLLALVAVGVVAALLIVGHSRKMAATSLHALEISKSSQDTLAYLVTYLVPFVTFSFDAKSALLADFMLLLFIGVLYLQSNMLYLNPTLALFGYRLYRVKTVNSVAEKTLIARALPKKGGIIRVIPVSEGIYIRHADD